MLCKAAMACHLIGEDHAGILLQEIAEDTSRPVVDPVLVRKTVRARGAFLDSVCRTTVRIDEASDSDCGLVTIVSVRTRT